MKIIIGIVLGCLLLGCGPEKMKDQIVIRGKAPAMKKVVLSYNTGMFRPVAEVVADSTGEFSLTCQLIRPGIYILSCDELKQNSSLFVKPGWEIQAKIEEDGISLDGDGREQNRFMKELKTKEKNLLLQYPVDFINPDSYKAATLSKYEELKEFIRSAKLKDRDFEGIVSAYKQVDAYNSLLNYPSIYQIVTGKTVVLPEDYYHFLSEIDLSSAYFINLGNVNSFFQDMFTAMESEGRLPAGLTDYLLKRAECIKDSLVRENYLLYALDLELFGYNQHLKEMIAGMESFIVTPAGKESLEELKLKYNTQAERNSGLNAGQPAFDFAGVDIQGRRHSFSDFAGKVVVVDVWNTGCKPCIAEIPYMRQLETRFARQDVAFISYSLEAEKEKWQDFVKDHDMEGNQWIETEAFKSPFARHYQVRSIPRFMVFDKEGKIVEVYAPRPSNPRLAALIGNELKK